MPILKGLEWTFDTVASTYEKLRPGYVEELYQKIFYYIPMNETSKVVEVGIGGGQATLPILQTGCELAAVEYGVNFSELCREKFKDFPKFSVITGKFEDVALAEDAPSQGSLSLWTAPILWVRQDRHFYFFLFLLSRKARNATIKHNKVCL